MLRIITIIAIAIFGILFSVNPASAIYMDQDTLAAQMAANDSNVTWSGVGNDKCYDIHSVNGVYGLTLEDGWHLTIAEGCTLRFRAHWPDRNDIRVTGQDAWIRTEGGAGQGEQILIGNHFDWDNGIYTYTY